MRIYCSPSALLAMLMIAFLIGLAVGTQMAGYGMPALGQHMVITP